MLLVCSHSSTCNKSKIEGEVLTRRCLSSRPSSSVGGPGLHPCNAHRYFSTICAARQSHLVSLAHIVSKGELQQSAVLRGYGKGQ